MSKYQPFNLLSRFLSGTYFRGGGRVLKSIVSPLTNGDDSAVAVAARLFGFKLFMPPALTSVMQKVPL